VPGTAQERSGPVLARPRVHFERPPVTETILGVQFLPLRGLTLPYLGLFWGEVRADYPTQEVKPALPPVVEDFSGVPGPEGGVGIQFVTEPDARCWFIDKTSTQLIQVQRDRFIRNWRKGQPPHDGYPRYDVLRPRFATDWTRFLAFLEREGLGRPEVNQCEVTYVNHIELGVGWENLGEAHKVLAMLRGIEKPGILPEPEVVILNARYVMPARPGRLHVSAQPAVRRSDGKHVLQLTLTARGKPDSSAIADILRWFDEGHDWIVYGFVDVTTPAMHQIWGRL
jgi:hypothetical protein